MYSHDAYFESREFNDLYFHDSEVSNLNFNYTNQTLEIKFDVLFSVNKSWEDARVFKNVLLSFSDCVYLSLSNYSPWSGKPKYLNGAKQDNNLDQIKHLKDLNLDGLLHFSLEFISGDYIHIYSKHCELYMEYEFLKVLSHHPKKQ